MSETASATFDEIKVLVVDKPKNLKALIDAALLTNPSSIGTVLADINRRGSIGSTEIAPDFFLPHVVTDAVPRIQLVLGTSDTTTWLVVLMPTNATPGNKKAVSVLMRRLAYDDDIAALRSFHTTEQFQHYLSKLATPERNQR
ncbi:hypothetical protein CDES_13550 [Corynebacterium deserti GIMN1.010]|uniref:Uncharacterized protein n=1 Tax=Corynebacterium deserti GIMN1.010 TaxID=931089 RepID=A0A0M4CI94_9CORY|nr:PTS sugar transporter subunit IIA [Corynebacterium deserti]ALC07040.1 hypothetical protein CDES_13550 [Corynebacterium deserti GIMN1.010]